MNLEERFEALMKNCEHLHVQNEEMAAQNEYLRKQLGESLKRKRRELRRSSSSKPPGFAPGEEEEEEEPHSNGSQVKMPLQGPKGEEGGIHPTLMTLKLTFQSLKGS